jgi:hypothetical protein
MARPIPHAEHLNRHIPTLVTGGCWKIVQQQRAPSPSFAYDLEQRAISALTQSARSLGGEMFECSPAKISEVWDRVVVAAIMADVIPDEV